MLRFDHRYLTHLIGSATLAFLILPILAVVPASFNNATFIQLPPEKLSLRWYGVLAQDPEWLGSFWVSVQVACLTTILAVVVGTAAAIGLTRVPPFPNKILFALMLTPMVVPGIIIAIALYYVGRFWGMVGTIPGLAIAHTIICLPFVVINVGVSLRSLDPTYLRAAEGLGARPLRVFRTVMLPVALPGILGGAVFSFLTSFDEAIISIFMAGLNAKTLPVKMWETVRLEFTPVLSAASTILIVVTIIFLVMFLLVNRGSKL